MKLGHAPISVACLFSMTLLNDYPPDEWAAAAAMDGDRPSIDEVDDPRWRAVLQQTWEADAVLRWSAQEVVAALGPMHSAAGPFPDCLLIVYKCTSVSVYPSYWWCRGPCTRWQGLSRRSLCCST